MKKWLVIAFVGISFFVFGLAWKLWSDFTLRGASENPQEVIYEVTRGKVLSSIAKDLQELGVIRNAQFFTLYTRLLGKGSKIKIGEYAFNTGWTPSQVLSVLMSGKSVGRPFRVSEGLNMFEIADLYEKNGFGKRADFLKYVRNPEVVKNLIGISAPSLEGYLFPETYQITKFTSLEELIASMIHNFNSVFSQIENSSRVNNLNKQEIVTLASIIEKETGAPEERETISSVFHNRLAKGMMLQTDPTVIYASALKTGKTVISITREDLRTAHPYNTYTVKGLPPGPISNPGKAALMAAVQPQETEFLFFVSMNEGRHQFSKDYESHNQAVKKFQLDAKAREGKSWRNMDRN